MVRPDAEGSTTRGDSGGESRFDGAGVMGSEGDSEALGPRPWDQGRQAQVPWSLRSFQTSYSSEFEAWSTVDERAQRVRRRTTASLSERASREEPQSGSGPSVSARLEGEEPVEGVRNPEDGTCRVRQARVMRISPPMSLKGRRTPGGANRSVKDR
jgi:hypothetical protein